MDPKTIVVAAAGLFLFVSGVVIIAAQAKWPERFFGWETQLAMRGINMKTNVVGFTVTFLGFILLLAQTGAGRLW